MKHFISHLSAALLLLALPFATLAQTGVGIGTTAPDASAALDIVSSTKGALLPRVADATAIASPATGLIVFQTGGTAGFYYNVGTPAAPSWQQIATAAGAAITASNGLTKTGQNVALGGTLTGATDVPLAGNNLTFSGATGNVGIGTSGTLPSRLTISPVTAEPKITLYNGASTINYYGLGISSYQLNYHTGINAGSHVFYAGGTNGDGTELLRIKNNGNVGIGTNNPRGQLDAAGTGDIYLVNSPNTGTTQTLYLPGHLFVAPFNGSNVSYLQARRADNSGTTALRLRTYNNGTLTETMHLEGNGNVGIGTTSPSFRLEVGGSFRSTLTNGNFSLYNNSATGGTVLLGALDGTGGNGPQFRFSGAGSGFMDIGQSAAGDFVVEGNDVARLTVLNGGSVGVGTSTPTARLDVEGGGLLVGNNTAISAQGAHLQWNRTGGEGETWLLNQKGLSTNGNDGIRFGSATQANGITEWGRFNGNGNFGLNQPNPTATLHVGGAASTVRLEGLAGTGSRSVTVAADGTLTTAASPSGTDFVQNQTAAAQTAGFKVSGAGTVGGLLTAGSATINGATTIAGTTTVTGTATVSGNVGIGITNPGNQLANTTSNTIGVSDGTNAFGGNVGSLNWAATQGGYVGQFYNGDSNYAGNGVVVKINGTSSNAVALDVSKGPQTTAATSLLTVKASGNVGIGIGTPSSTLHVGGAASTVRLEGLAGTGSRSVTVAADGTLTTAATPSGTDFVQNQTATAQTAGFNVSGSGAVGGRLGVGTATPNARLEAVGDLRVGAAPSNGQINTFGSAGGTGVTAVNLGQSFTLPAAATLGSVTLQSGNTFSTTLTVYSGTGNGGTALTAALPISFVAGTPTTLTFPAGLSLAAGTYTLGLVTAMSGNSLAGFTPSVYAGGTLTGNAAPIAGYDLAFTLTYAASGATTLYAATGGSVGIGTDTPGATLDVAGAASTVRLQGLAGGTVRTVTVGTDGTLGTTASPSGTNFIQNQTTQQASSNFNISGTGAADQLAATSTLFVDAANANTGTFTGSSPLKGVVFGSAGSGEGIGANRAGSTNTFGVDIYTNFTPRLSVSNGGNVGIGTTTPVTKLSVKGLGYAFPATTGITQSTGHIARLSDGSNLVLDMGGFGVNGIWLQSTDAGNLATNYPLLLNPNSGNVGIGTTSPFSQLANTPTNMNGSNGQGGNAKSLTWAGSQTGYMALLYNGQVGGAHGLAVKVAGSDVSTSVLDVSAGTAQTTAAPSLFKVQANGYVGVGVSGNPAATLHVGGAASTVRLEGLGNGTTTRNVTVAADGTLTTAALPSGTNFIQNQTSAQTADFNVSGTATVAGATNINTGTSTAATNIGTGTGANTVSVGNSAATVAVTGATTVTGTTTLNGSGTATTSIGSGTATGITNINTGASSGATNIGTGSAAGAVTIGRSGGTVTIPKLTTAGLVTTDASGNLSSSSSGVANGLFWGLSGNSGTSPGTHFLGTTDAQDLVFKVGGTERMRLKQNGALSLSVGGAGGNTFVGENSGQNVVVASAYSNTFLGSGAGQSSTTGVNNTYVGTVAGRYATIASNNTAVGTQAGANMSKSGSGGSGNSLVGSSAGNLIDAGIDNTLMGNNAGRSIVGNSGNSFFGAGTGELSTGTNNTFIGTTTGASMLSGNQNVFLGASAGRFELGSGNIHIGYNAGPGSGTGTNNTLLGTNATISAGLSNATAIGNGASVTASNALVLGSGANVGIGTTAPFTQLTNVPTASNVIGSDNNGVGSQSLNWVNTTAGYAGAFYNSSTGGAGNGLAVKVAGTSGVALDVSQNAAVGTAGTTLLRVGGNGNVGIGTSTAVSRLSFGSAVNANAAAGRLAIYEGASGTEFYGLGLVLGPSSYGMGLWGGSGAANPYNGSTGALPQLYLDRNSANAGIGTITPGTRLDVNGGLTLDETASTALTGASPSYVIPANVSMVRLVASGTAPTGTIALSSTSPVTGQQLYVYNTTTIPATLNGLTIGAGQSLSFFYSNGAWQTTAANAAGNGLSATAGTINLGGTLTAATTTLTAGANTYAITQNANPLTLAVDQSDIAAAASGYTNGNNYQTFTAGVTGILSQVELQLGNSGGVVTNFTLTIRAGAGTGGAVLYSGATSYTGIGGQTNYAFPVNAALTNGSTYTIQLTDPSNGTYWSYNTANPYAGGSANINAAYDFLFRTTVASPGAAVANWPVFTAKGGLIGIGTTTPSYTLDVNGYVRCTGLTQTSDARLKQDVRPIGQALAAVQALRGVRYTFRRAEFPAKQLPVGEQLGFLAQEVEKIYPELVSTDPEGFKAVNYAQLTPVLLEAIKELNARNTALQGQVNALQGRAAQADTDHASLLTLQAQMARLLGEAPAGAQARK